MLFKPYHIPMIKSGKKTATRRVWKKPHAKVGGIYTVQTRLYEPAAGCPLIRVEKIYEQPLGEMTVVDARAEGYPTLDHFRMAWSKINGSYDPAVVVTVVEFYYLEGTGLGRR